MPLGCTQLMHIPAENVDGESPLLPDTTPLYVVGPATSRALCSSPYINSASVYGQETGNGEALASYIKKHYSPRPLPPPPRRSQASEEEEREEGSQPRPALWPLLFLVGVQRRDIISRILMQEHGRDPSSSVYQTIPVHEVEVYQTGLSPTFARDLQTAMEVVRGSSSIPPKDYTGGLRMSEIPSAAALVSKRRTIWIVVFSPTGTRELLLFLGLLNPSTGRVQHSSSSSSSSKTSGVVILLPIRRDCHGTKEEGKEEEEEVKAGREREGSGGDEGGEGGEKEEEVEILIAAIGPTTRDHLIDNYSFQPHVTALHPTPQGVGDGIRRFLLDRYSNRGA